jgi:hypothetical protein
MDDVKMLKEKAINNYMHSADLDNIDINQIKNDLHQIIGEIPAIKLNYEQESLLNEDGSDTGKKLEKLESIELIYTYERDMEVNGRSIPVPIPVTKKFFL